MSTIAQSHPAPGRFAALKYRDCRWFLGGTLLAMMADNVEHVISYWVLYQTFQSPALAGFAVISHWVPFLLFSVHIGSLCDRYDCRKIVQLAQLLFMFVSLCWGVLFMTESLQMWHAVVLLVIHGLAGAIWSPPEQLILHDIVGRDALPSAVRLNATARSLGLLAGPAVGSALLFGLGETAGIFANVLLYVPFTLWLLRVPYTGHLRDGEMPKRPPLTIRAALGTLREVASNAPLISMVILGGLGSLFIGTALAPLMPEYARLLGAERAGPAYGALLAAGAAGAVVGGIALEATGILKSTVRSAIWCTVVYGLAMAAFAISRDYALSLTLLFIGGIANLASSSMSQAMVQLLAPPDMRGRIIGVYHMSASGLRAGSGLTIGVLGGFIGVHASLAMSAAALCLSSILLLAYLRRTPSAT